MDGPQVPVSAGPPRELRSTPDEQRRAAQRRFRAWLDLALTDGAIIAAAHESAVQQLTPEQQAELDVAERDAVLNGLSYREFVRLAEFVPWLRAWNVPSPPERRVSLPPLLATSLALTAPA